MDKTSKIAAYIMFFGLMIYLILSSLGDGGRSILSWLFWIAFGIIILILIIGSKE